MVALRFRLLLVLAALLAFGGALWAPFQFDDFSLLADPSLDSPSGWRQALEPLQTRPLTFLTFWANVQVSREPWTFHVVNLVLHLLSVWLISGVLLELVPHRAAYLATALFAVHPLQTEAVVYIFARATLLAAVLCLLSVLLWLRGRRWAAAAAFCLALLAKEEVAAFPLLLALLEWSGSRRRDALAPLSAMLALAAAAGARAAWAASSIAGSGAGAQAGITSFDYFSYQGVAILRYLWLTLVPLGLTVDAEVRTAPLAAALAWGAISVVVLLSWRTLRAAQPGFWILSGLVLLLPSSSVFPAADLAADRRMYLPLLCFAAAFGLLLRRGSMWLLWGYAAALCVLSVAQTRVWQDPYQLWLEAARQAPSKIRPKRQLARILPPEEAIQLLEEARRLSPDDPAVATDLGIARIRAGDPAQALPEFGRALALDPASATALHNRGLALLLLGQRDAAIADFRRSLEKDPCLFDARLNLARLGEPLPAGGGCRWTAAQQRAISAP